MVSTRPRRLTGAGPAAQVGNFRVEPPGLFRGRGEHPKMGMMKRRIHPRDITINIGAPRALALGRAVNLAYVRTSMSTMPLCRSASRRLLGRVH